MADTHLDFIALREDMSNPVGMINDMLEMFQQEIKVLFSCPSHEVFANDDEWVDIEQYVFMTNLDNMTLENKIRDSIRVCCPHAENFIFTVNMSFVRGELSDIGVVDVSIFLPNDPNTMKASVRGVFG